MIVLLQSIVSDVKLFSFKIRSVSDAKAFAMLHTLSLARAKYIVKAGDWNTSSVGYISDSTLTVLLLNT